VNKFCKYFSVIFLIFSFTLNAEIWNYSGNVYASNGTNFIYKGLIDSSNKIAVKKNDCYNASGEIIIKEHTEYMEKTCEILNTHIQDLRTGKEEIIIDRDSSSVIGLLVPFPSFFADLSELTPIIRISPQSLALHK